MKNCFECIGYHQASIENAQSSVRWQSFHVSSKKNLWLGEGIYFWQRYNDAVWWDGRSKSPAIVSAKIKCPSELFLDLDNEEEKNEFKENCEKAMAEAKKANISIKFEHDDVVATFLCNFYKRSYDLLLIRYSFPESSGRPQLCATDTSILSEIKMVSMFVGGRYLEA